MRTPVHDFLSEYADADFLRCHMPGHKGGLGTFDITEIFGADSLYDCNGIIGESEKIASKLFGAQGTLFSCGGSTLSIQTMLAAAKIKSGKTSVTAGRYSHRSLVSCAALLGLDIDWVYPHEYLSCCLDAADLEKQIKPETAAVFITSVDYYGGVCDVKALANIAETHRLPLLADNAHGAYLVFTENHPIRNGAAMSADSAHKTLPALTGTAYLHFNKPFSHCFLKQIMALFGSTSPSYLMLDSLDLCNKFIYEHRDTAEKAFKNVIRLKERLESSGFELRRSDDMRVTVSVRNGYALAGRLREKRIECEFCDDNNVVLLFSAVSGDDCERVYTALTEIIRKDPAVCKPAHIKAKQIPIKPKKAMSPQAALFGKSRETDIKEAAGAVCAAVAAPCPPGVPLVMPGEIYDEASVEMLSELGVKKTRILI